MDQNKNYSENKNPQADDIWGKLTLPTGRDKAAVWEDLAKKTTQSPAPKKHWIRSILVAASLLFLISILTMRFYTQKISTPPGQHLAHTLPDGSLVHLNAASSIYYAPYWWSFNRAIELNGEAFFEVQKGSDFEVVSTLGTTTVLGTSFNIFARRNQYKVYCKTGKVQVCTVLQDTLLLTPQETAVLEGSKLVKHISNRPKPIYWINNQFHFEQIAIDLVIEEIERQYDVTIDLDIKNIERYLYTGFFEKTTQVQQTLEIVSVSMGLQLEQKSSTHYSLYSM
jgi:ferric-dicitrate binding protein FerR (iron transport regulator)